MGNKLTADVVVVGAGFAGLAAALEARHYGASTILFCDKGFLTNNSAISGGLFALTGTPLQEKMGVKDSPELFMQDIMRSSSSKADSEIVRTFTQGTRDMYEWLIGFGAEFPVMTIQAGHSVLRVHQEVGERGAVSGRGSRLVKLLHEAARAQGVGVHMRTPVTGLLTNEKRAVTGVTARDNIGEEFQAEARRGVVLCAGSIGRNKEMLKKYAPRLVKMVNGNASGSTGHGIRMGMEVGAAIANLDAAVMSYTVSPAGAKSSDVVHALRLVIPESVIVNKHGHRFVDETMSSYRVGAELMCQPNKAAFTIFDRETFKKAGLDTHENVISANNPEELGLKLGIEAKVLTETITDYNKAVPKVDAYDHPIQKRPLLTQLFAIALTSRIIFNYGGLKINPQAQAISQSGNTIPGLFAAGDNATGICGPANAYNAVPGYLTGCGNMGALVFGRIAGRNAAKR